MKKKLIIINGTMGVGKTTVCKTLYKKLHNSVWLDGDWCWMINPFDANEYNRSMVVKNIGYLLRSFLQNPAYEYIVFTWVIHLEEIYRLILAELSGFEFEQYKMTLLCDEEELRERIHKDTINGVRTEDSIERSIERLQMYKELNSIKIETGKRSIQEITDEIVGLVT